MNNVNILIAVMWIVEGKRAILSPRECKRWAGSVSVWSKRLRHSASCSLFLRGYVLLAIEVINDKVEEYESEE